MNFLHLIIEVVLPYVIGAIEIIGVVVIFCSAIIAFIHYIQNTFLKKHLDIQHGLAQGLAMGLEFEMAAEILKTILIQNMEEIYILGGIIVLRIALSLLIHFENRAHNKEEHSSNGDEDSSKKEENPSDKA